MISRLSTLLFGVVGYALFFATFLYLIGFVTGWFVPFTVDGGGPESSLAAALAIDAALIALFGVQHGIMARPWFKRWLTRLVPQSIERTCFVLATCGVFAVMFTQWRAIPTVLWSFDGVTGNVLLGVGLVGWLIVLLSTFLIDHFDLFGLRQVWLAFRGRPYVQRVFVMRGFYRWVRHPLMLGFLIAFWAAPTMTMGRFAFATFYTLYILLALVVEERDLVALHGDSYREYQRNVPKLLPIGTRQAKALAASQVR